MLYSVVVVFCCCCILLLYSVVVVFCCCCILLLYSVVVFCFVCVCVCCLLFADDRCVETRDLRIEADDFYAAIQQPVPPLPHGEPHSGLVAMQAFASL
jgi:hypothetical protein